jgi:hypothetical protein
MLEIIFAGIIAFAALFAAFVEIWHRFVKPVMKDRKERKERVKEKKKQLKDRMIGIRNILKDEDSFRKENIELFDLIDCEKLKSKIQTYNITAEKFVVLSYGCRQFVRLALKRSVIHYLKEKRDVEGAGTTEWEFGTERGYDLSDVIFKQLGHKLIRGEEINKPLIESIDSTFYDELRKRFGDTNVKYFLNEINKEIRYQRNYGILKLFEEIHSELLHLLDSLIKDINAK